MFCSKCGNQVEDVAKFCDKCGTPTTTDVNTSVVKEKKVDNEVQLVVKPKFKRIYFMLSSIILSALLVLLGIIFSVAVGEVGIFIAMLIISLVILLISWISSWFKQKQLECMEYSFYNTKVVYKDSFLNKAEKEVKYKYIRECLLLRTVTDRIFGFGRVILYTNAETGFGNGIVIPFLADSEDVHKRIKELLDD